MNPLQIRLPVLNCERRIKSIICQIELSDLDIPHFLNMNNDIDIVGFSRIRWGGFDLGMFYLPNEMSKIINTAI